MENLRVGDVVKINKNYGNTIKEGDIGVLLRVLSGNKVVVNLDEDRAIHLEYITLIKSKKDADSEIKEFKTKTYKSIEQSDKIKLFTVDEDKISNLKDELNYELRNRKSYLNRLNDVNLKIRNYYNQIEGLKLGEKNGVEKIVNELSLILNHPTVLDIKIENNQISVYTDYIDIYDEEGRRFKGNAYRIIFDANYSAPRIFGTDPKYCRTSCWSAHDPHPHVSGNSGDPCYGNSGSMIASAISDMEYYVAYTIVLNFLQQVNTDDSAGEKVRNWDCVDENDNIIENPHTVEEYTCNICNWSTEDDDEMYTCDDCGIDVCYECSDYSEDYGRICEKCFDENYVKCPECGSIIREGDGYINEKHEENTFCDKECYDNYYESYEEEEEEEECEEEGAF